MYSFKNEASSTSREKVNFPVDLAVSDVTLRNVQRNERILGIDFNFQRVEGNTISFLTGSILPPKLEWYSDKVIEGKTISASDQFESAIKSFMGYVKHILYAAGVAITGLDNVTGNTLEELIDNAIATANTLIDPKATFYLKTIKDKNGYTKIPQYRGTGVAQATDLGYPTKHAYSVYEQDILDSIGDLNVEKVVDVASTPTPTKGSGMDF